MVWVRLFMFGEKVDPFEVEARHAEKMPTLTMDNFLNGTFQDELESALSDQMPTSEKTRSGFLTTKHIIFDNLSWISNRKNSKYRLVADDIYLYGGDDNLVVNSLDKKNLYLEQNASDIAISADYYSKLPITNKYQYVITTDDVKNFDDVNDSYIEKLASYYPSFKQSSLSIPDYDTYARYFLKTDHHWNYKGAYQGYKDIIKLMLGTKEPVMEPAEKVDFKYDVVGSRSRIAFFMNIQESFSAYRFAFPEHDTYISGQRSEYGMQKSYFDDPALRNGTGEINYGIFYGPDVDIVEYDFKQPEKQNLLMIGFSDTNAINELVASHFNKTWIIDTRFCSRAKFEEIISENNIQNLLLLPNGRAYIPIMPIEAKGYDS